MRISLDNRKRKMNPAQFEGLNIFVSPLLPRLVQAKRHKRNKRINKKWLRKYGMKSIEEAIVTPMGVFVSRETYARLRAFNLKGFES